MIKRNLLTTISAVMAAVMLTACGASDNTGSQTSGKTDNTTGSTVSSSIASTDSVSGTNASLSSGKSESVDTEELFSKRDLNQTPDISDAETITVESGKTYTISEAGTYVFKGTASNSTIQVEADKEGKVQLVLDGLSITNDSFPAIYVVSCDKCFITTSGDSSLTVTGSFVNDGDTKTDAVIYSKDDLVFNGTGKLTIVSNTGNGISGKDDIKFTGGTYDIGSALDAIEANDSIAVYDGNFTISTSKDGLHSENSDDNTVGWIYIKNGTFDIKAKSDGIQGTTYVQIDGGDITINGREGIEATYVQINGGNINITASDDGINASSKSSIYSLPVIEFNGGYTVIVVGDGDTDGVDSNGNIIVNGGTIDVTGKMSTFDYEYSAEFNGGTIIANGEEVDEIPQSMMGGPGGGFGGQGGFGGGGFGGQDGNFGGGFPNGGFKGGNR